MAANSYRNALASLMNIHNMTCSCLRDGEEKGSCDCAVGHELAEIHDRLEAALSDGPKWQPDDLRYAFVAGAKWWQYKANGSTAFASEVDEMEVEADRRYATQENK